MKRLFTLMMLLIIFLTGASMQISAVYENDYLELNEDNNYIFTNVGDSLNTENIRYSDYFGKVVLDNGTISNISDGLTETGTLLEVTSPGVHSFDFTYAGLTNTIYVMAKLDTEDGYMLYDEAFEQTNDGFLPLGINLTDGTAEVQNHVLELDSVAETTKIQFPSLLKVFSNYTISMDFTFDQTNSSSRWMTVMFRGAGYNFYQVVFRQGGAVSNGIELNKSTNGSISSLQLAAFTSEFELGESYHLEMEVSGNQVIVSIDGVEFINYTGLNDYANGFIGMQANGNVALIDNIEIAYDSEGDTTHNFMSVPRLYQLESNANQTPTLVREMQSLEDVETLSQALRPHVAVFTLDSDLNVLDASGNVMMSAYDALLSADAVAIPAFRVPSASVASQLASLLEENRILDVYVVSDNYMEILEAHQIYEYIKGVLEVPYDSAKDVLAYEDLYDIKVNALTSFSFVVWLAEPYLNQETVGYYHDRLLQVWASDGSSSKGEVSEVIYSGADGVVTTSEFTVLTVLNELPENTLLTEPMLIGHRGMPARGPENTVESSQLALDSGADAVECDIRLSIDDKIVVMHDTTTQRTTGVNLTVSQATYEEITSLEILHYFEDLGTIYVPGLEDYFEAFQDQDMMLIIEIKDTDTLIVEKLRDLLVEYPNMRDNIIVISFDPNQMYKMKETLPDIPLAYLNGAFSAGDIETTIENHLKLYVPMGAISNVHYESLWEEYLLAFHHRGISTTTWTVNDETILQNFYLDGTRGITTDIAYMFSDTWNKFTLNDTAYTYDLNAEVSNESFTIRGNIYTNDMDEYPHNPVYSIIDDGGTDLVIENSKVMSASTAGVAYIQTVFETSLPDGRTMTLFGDVIKINVIDSSVPLTCETGYELIDGSCQLVEEPESSNALVVTGIVTGSVAVVGGVGFFLFKKGIIKL